jgi:hypothetical protein
MSETPKTPLDDEDAVAKIIRLAGRRPVAAQEARARVYAAVHERWRKSVTTTARASRLMPWLAAAAALVGVAIGVTLLRSPGGVANAAVANLQTARGELWIARAGSPTWELVGDDVEELRAGDALRTAGDGRAVLLLWPGASLRLNADTSIVLNAADRIEVARGTIYLDSGAPQRKGNSTHLQTPLGEVWDVGTQFELRADAQALRIRVREGTVQFQGKDRDREVHSEAGDEVLIPAQGDTVRGRIAPYDDAWSWAADLASFHAQGDYTAATLLDWVGRETGRTLRFDGPATRAHAETLLLHGAEGLSPQDTLAVVAATTDLRYELETSTIVVSAAQR